MRVLRRLDDRVVPALGRALRGGGRAAADAADATGEPGRMLLRGVRRYSVAVAAVALSAVAAVLILITGGDQRAPVRPKPSTVVPPLSGQRLGPVTGSSASAYLVAANQRLRQLSGVPDGQLLTAIVDLTGYLTPAAVTSSLTRPGVTMEIAFAKVPTAPSAPIHALDLKVAKGLAPALTAARATAQAVLDQYHNDLLTESRSPSRKLAAEISAALRLARQARVDARGLGPTCGCVFALLVRGPLGQLRSLATATDVRVLDPAPPATSLRQLMVVPLEPQVTGTVPPVQFAGE